MPEHVSIPSMEERVVLAIDHLAAINLSFERMQHLKDNSGTVQVSVSSISSIENLGVVMRSSATCGRIRKRAIHAIAYNALRTFSVQ